MKTTRMRWGVLCWLAFASFLTFAPDDARGQTSTAPYVSFWYPTNGQTFVAPATIGVHALVVDLKAVVRTVEYFAGGTSIGIVTNTARVMLTNTTSTNPFFFAWSNVVAGSYALTAVATDANGVAGTSAPVHITVTSPAPVHPAVYIYSPANGAEFVAPATVKIYGRALESGGIVQTVEFFAGRTSLGVVSNSSQVVVTNLGTELLFPLTWSNAPAGTYALTAVATDAHGMTGTSQPVSISVVAPPPPLHPTVYIYSPANGAKYVAPASLTIYAHALESTGRVETVEFFAGGTSLGVVSNSSQVTVTNVSSVPLFPLAWSNVLAGNYVLTAIATDAHGMTGTSQPVSISVVSPPPPPHPIVYIYSPANGAKYTEPANVTIYAHALASTGIVQTVAFFAGNTSLGVVSNSSQVVITNLGTAPLFPLAWSNVLAGSYTLTAVATDALGMTGTSQPVNITVVTNPPPPPVHPSVYIYSPASGAKYLAPANLTLYARSVETTGIVETVEFFAGTNSLGVVPNSSQTVVSNLSSVPLFPLGWSNVLVGTYILTALATDAHGMTGTSQPVSISVVSNLPPVVSIYAPDPVAIEGTNGFYYRTGTAFTNYCSGTNTATFLVRRDGETNTDLTVYYSIGGTATNGVDYATIPDNVTIPAGRHYALITIVPLDDADSVVRHYDTVILALTFPPTPTNTALPYTIGSPGKAGAIILEENHMPLVHLVAVHMPDDSLHVSLPANNGVNFCLQISTNLSDWLPVCTNTVVKGSAQFVDPSGNPAGLYYRIVPASGPPNY